MPSYNPKNERIKRQYFTYLKEARQQSEATVDAVAEALDRFEEYTRRRDFRAFHIEQAVGFKNRLLEDRTRKGGRPLSKATVHGILSSVKRFFQWLSMQPGYKATVRYTSAEYFNLSEKDVRTATAKREVAFPTVEQVEHVIATMSAKTDVEKRNRALVAFALITAARNGALISFKLRHLNIAGCFVDQDAREVKTKNSKTFRTYFVPVSEMAMTVVEEWVRFCRIERGAGDDAPLFPATQTGVGKDRRFEAVGLSEEHWRTTSAVRDVFRAAFNGAGLAYFHPHTLRKTLVAFAEKACLTPEQFKAFSQNIGHESPMTTFSSYGAVQVSRQGEIIRELARQSTQSPNVADEIVEKLARRLVADGILNPR
jgi:integrase/recombinase XerD